MNCDSLNFLNRWWTYFKTACNRLQKEQKEQLARDYLEAKLPTSLIPEEIREDMVNLWSVFNMEFQNVVPISELRVIMRALDFDLNPEQLALTRQQIDPTNEGIIRFAMLEKVMEDKLKDVDTYDDMILEFKKLDKDKDGKIPAPEFKQYMKNMGSKLSQDEIEEMMKIADPKGDGSVDLDEFCQTLCPPKPK